MQITFVFFLALITAVPAIGQESREALPRALVSNVRWGSVRLDSAERVNMSAVQMLPLVPDDQPGRKSPYLAGALSLLVPGAGEVYCGSYLLGGIFLAAEATGWYFNIDQNRRGDDATTEFEKYADEHWSVVKYAEWLNNYAKNFKGGENSKTIAINPDQSLPPWQRVDWEALNEVEAPIEKFSHRLPAHGEQQYYELIGKYLQYSYGWDDKLEQGDGWSDLSPSSRYHQYSGMRGDANSFYNTAETIASLIIVNHLLSAIDAAWAATRFNKTITFHSQTGLMYLPDGTLELHPMASISVHF
jgi:hypothetical protein